MNTRSILSLSVVVLLDSPRVESQSNFQPCPSSPGVQVEPMIASHPLNPNIMLSTAFVNWTTDNGMWFPSTDAGVTWLCSIFPPHLVFSSLRPVIDKDGVMIIAYVDFLTGGISAMYSTNNGQSWLPGIQISSGVDDDPRIATDDVPSSAHYGRTYAVWSDFGVPYSMAVSYTTNNGSSWLPPQLINQVPPSSADLGVGSRGVLCT